MPNNTTLADEIEGLDGVVKLMQRDLKAYKETKPAYKLHFEEAERSIELSRNKEKFKDYIAFGKGWSEISGLCLLHLYSGIKETSYVTGIRNLIGCNYKLDVVNKCITKGKDKEKLTVKQFGKITKLSKCKNWSILAEKLKLELTIDYTIKYFTKYEDIRKYFTDTNTSGNSCMRYEFKDVPLHPCIVYAQDSVNYASKTVSIKPNVSEGIALAVLFYYDKPHGRAVVNTKSKTRGSCFGDGASILAKMLDYDGGGIDGYINIVVYEEQHIMPYIDGAEVVDTDGEIGTGDMKCNGQTGYSVEGIWSEYREEHIPEDSAVWSDHHQSYIDREGEYTVFSETEQDWLDSGSDGVAYSNFSDTYLLTDSGTHIYLSFMDDYIPDEEVEEVTTDWIRYNVDTSTLISFAEEHA